MSPTPIKSNALRATLLSLSVTLALTGVSTAQADSDPADWSQKQKFSYSLGWALISKFKKEGLDLDGETMAQAVQDVLSEQEPQLDAEQRTAALRAQRALEQQRAQQEKKMVAENNQSAGEAYLASNAKNPSVKVLDGGVQYEVLNSGDGKQPSANDTVIVHYHGSLIDGTVFDSSVERGKPASFPVNGVVPGFSTALQAMKEGDKWRVSIPADQAYGSRGAGKLIGPNTTLIFELELIEVK